MTSHDTRSDFSGRPLWAMSVVVWLGSLTVDVFSSAYYVSQRDEPSYCGEGIAYLPGFVAIVLAGYALRRVYVHSAKPEHSKLLGVVAATISVTAAITLLVSFAASVMRPGICLD